MDGYLYLSTENTRFKINCNDSSHLFSSELLEALTNLLVCQTLLHTDVILMGWVVLSGRKGAYLIGAEL